MNKKPIINIAGIIFIVPFLVWLYMFRDYLTGHLPAMTLHGLDYYHIIKSIMEAMSRGVFPLWDPYYSWGMPQILDLRFVGEYNPFHWLFVLFASIGVPRPQSFLLYAFLYYFLGVIGFYFLAGRIFKDKFYAVISMSLLLFSSIAFNIFENISIIYLCVPVIWFFYFLVSFFQDEKKQNVLGLTFSLMIITITYMPFYFIALFLAVAIPFVFLYFGQAKALLNRLWHFGIQHKVITLLCLFALGLSMVPGINWYRFAESGDYVTYRHKDAPDQHSGSLARELIEEGGVGGQITLTTQFAGFKYSRNMRFYMPIFIYLSIVLSLFNPLSRKLLLYFIAAFFLYIIALTKLTPVHKFLYDHIFIFRLFRNIYFLVYLSMPIYILFAVEQYRLFLENIAHHKRKLLSLVFIVVVHGLFCYFLSTFEEVVLTSYITVGLSLLFSIFYLFGLVSLRKPFFKLILLFIVLLQPVEVFHHYVKNELGFAFGMAEWHPTEKFQPKFFHDRPPAGSLVPIKGETEGNPNSDGFWKIDYGKWMGLRWAFETREFVDNAVLETHTKNKFWIYDHVANSDGELLSFGQIQDAMLKRTNLAFVENTDPGQWEDRKDLQTFKARAITGDSEQFKVLDFDLNHVRLETDFDNWKFLVYTDTYHPKWQARVNDVKTKVFKANHGFKGVWLPPGKNEVYFKYGSRIEYVFCWGLVFFYAFFLGFLVYSCKNSQRAREG